jgi:DNA-binding MarR family transcriptional regulator
MSKWDITENQLGSVYGAFWRLMDLSVHRYGSHPTGKLYIVLTIMMLDRVDYHPTVGELAEIVRLPKSTVSRYVSAEMNSGYLEEVIDPDDRRRRRLHLTSIAREEGQWHQGQIRQITELSSTAFNENDFAGDGKAYFEGLIADSRSGEDHSR